MREVARIHFPCGVSQTEGQERTLGRDHPDTLMSVGNMGSQLQAQGKLSLAEPYFLRALEGCERTLGRDDPHTLMVANSLRLLLEAMEKEEVRQKGR